MPKKPIDVATKAARAGIREIAKLHDITTVENPVLTRALYKDVEIGKEIPVEYYKAVAEVINYVNSLKDKR